MGQCYVWRRLLLGAIVFTKWPQQMRLLTVRPRTDPRKQTVAG